jgi:hypothetical protein
MVVNLQQHWYLPFDNMSFINEETSDTLCRATTGGGMQQRKLNTNAEDTIFVFQRCIAINGIHNVATRSDLLDRSILVELMRIKDNNRKELSAVIANFEADKAEILGGIFDTLVKAIAIFPTVQLQNLPRMADFARWGYAIGEALGGLGQQFLDEYTGNRRIQNEEAIASDPTATLIVEHMRKLDSCTWYGRYSELFKLLKFIAPDFGINTSHKSFPANSIVLSKKLTAIKSNLEAVGISVVRDETRSSDGQRLSLKRIKSSTLTPLSTQCSNNAALRRVDNHVDEFEGTASTQKKRADELGGISSTQSTTPGKPANNAACVGDVHSVDDFTHVAGAAFTADENLSDIPLEFLNATPQGQISL